VKNEEESEHINSFRRGRKSRNEVQSRGSTSTNLSKNWVNLGKKLAS